MAADQRASPAPTEALVGAHLTSPIKEALVDVLLPATVFQNKSSI